MVGGIPNGFCWQFDNNYKSKQGHHNLFSRTSEAVISDSCLVLLIISFMLP